jgi:hypothetical protein
MAFAKESEVRKSTVLVADGGFTCIVRGAVLIVEEDEDGLWVSCSEGRHYLDGQLTENGEYVGLMVKS